MKKIFILILLLCSLYINAQNNYKNSELFIMPYAGYCLEHTQNISHGVNFGCVAAANKFLLGCEFKVDCKKPESGNYSYGGYCIVGIKCDFMAIGGMLGGVNICETCKPMYATIYGEYKQISYDHTYATKFDGGIMLMLELPSKSRVGAGVLLSSTYYTPISVSVGIYIKN